MGDEHMFTDAKAIKINLFKPADAKYWSNQFSI